MRAIVIGDPAVNGLSEALGVGFRDNGWTVDAVPWGSWRPSSLASAGHRWPIAARPFVWRMFRSLAAGHADLVVVVKGAFLGSRDIARLRQRTKSPVVCWNPDDPFDSAMSNRGAGIPAAISSYDYYVTWSEAVADRLSQYRPDVIAIPFGWDPTSFFPEEAETEQNRVVFVGSWTAEREQWMRSCSAFQPVVFGDRWPEIPSVRIRSAVYGSGLRQVLTGANVALNFLRPQNRSSHNMRTFEIPGCGGRQVAQRSPEHERLLAPHGVRLFEEPDELVEILAEECDRVPDGQTPAWLHEETYARRVARLLDVVGS